MTIYGQSEELVSRCVECDLAEPESLASLGGSAPGLVDGILSETNELGWVVSLEGKQTVIASYWRVSNSHIKKSSREVREW